MLELDRAQLPSQLGKTLVQGDGYDATTISAVEKALGAFLIIRPDRFGGLLLNFPFAQSPTRILLYPEGCDWIPEVQAIAHIGLQYYYWLRLSDRVSRTTEEMEFDFFSFFALNALPVYFDAQGNISVDVLSNREIAERIARERHRPEGYTKIVNLVNPGGSATFYGAIKKHIFPMRITGKDGEVVQVTGKQIGVTNKLAEKVWQSWMSVYTSHQNLFRQAVAALAASGRLPPNYRSVIVKGVKTADLHDSASFTSWLHQNNLSIDSVEYDQIQDAIEQMIRERVIAEGVNSPFVQATRAHADNLKHMYEAARNCCWDLWSY